MFTLELVCYCWKMQLLGKPKACESMRDYGLILGLFALRILHIVETFVCRLFDGYISMHPFHMSSF